VVFFVGSGAMSIREAKRIVQTLVLFATVVFWAFAAYYFWFHLDPLAARAYVEIRTLLLIVIPLAVFSQLWNGIIYAENRILSLNRSAVLVQVVSALVLITGMFLHSITLPYVFFSMLLAHVVQASYLWAVSRPVPAFGCNLRMMRRVLSLGFQGYIGNLANYGNYRISYFLITRALGASSLGLYSLSVLLSEKTLDVTNAASTVLLPRVAREESSNGSHDRTERIARVNLILTVLICGVALISAPLLIRLMYGTVYSKAAQYFCILLPGTLALSVSRITAAHLGGKGRVWETSWPVILLFPLVTVALWWGLPRWGLVWAATVTSLSYILLSILVVANYVRCFKRRWTDVFRFQKDDLPILPHNMEPPASF
jgi:O-antigen/teichoic acid export membrane protein